MGLFSWFTGDKPDRSPSADITALGLWEAVVYGCSSQQIAETRTSMRINPDAIKFDAEFFYLNIFLTLKSVEIAYRDSTSFRNALTDAFIGHMKKSMATGSAVSFPTSPRTLQQRLTQYFALSERGIEGFLDRIPFTFVDSIREDADDTMGMSALAVEMWVGAMLEQSLLTHQWFREQFGF